MEYQACGLISLDALDSMSRARALCRYQTGERARANITAAHLPDTAAYIAIIWAGGRPVILGELRKTPRGWEIESKCGDEPIDAAFVAYKAENGLSVVLAGKAMGAKLDLNQALFRVRMLKKPEPKRKASAPLPDAPAAEHAARSEPSERLHKEEACPAAALPPQKPALERFVASGSGRSIAPRPNKAPKAGSPPAKEHKRPDELLRRERPSYSRTIGNPFPGHFSGASWVLARYPGAQHPHYLAGHWKTGGREALVSAVPGESAPKPPPWLTGFAKHLTSRWGQGYWIGVTDYRTGKPWKG